jgi:hypothetical protein
LHSPFRIAELSKGSYRTPSCSPLLADYKGDEDLGTEDCYKRPSGFTPHPHPETVVSGGHIQAKNGPSTQEHRE